MLSHKNKITFWCHLIHQVNEYLKSFHEKIVLFKNRKQTTKRMNLLCQGKNANKQIKTDWFVFFRYENLMLQRNDYDGDLFATAKQRIVSSYKIITECRRKSRTLPHCK